MFEDLQDTQVNRHRRRHREDTEMDITPMIDVTFLLLIFFIVASRMDPKTAVDEPTAKHGSVVAEDSAAVIIIEPGATDEPLIYLGNIKEENLLATGSIEDQDNQIEDYVRAQLGLTPPKIAVLIKADKDLQFRHIDRVSKAASRALVDEEGFKLHLGIIERR